MDVVALAALVLAAWAAARPDAGEPEPLARHVAWGLGAALMNLVARCIAIFYMLASGRAVKDLVAEHGLDPSYAVRAKKLKRGVETLATVALIPVMTAAIIGGAIKPDGSGAGPHAWWSWASIAAAALCLAVDGRVGLRNYALLREVDGITRS